MKRSLGIAALSIVFAACGGGGGGGDGGPMGIGLEDLNQDGNILVVFFGDSITRGQGDGGSPNSVPSVSVAGYPARFRDLTGVSVINAGVGGEQTSSGRRRLQRLLPATRPDYVVILEGVNDVLPGREVDTIGNLRAMVGDVFANGAMPVLATLTPTCCNHAGSAPLSHVEFVSNRIRELAFTTLIPGTLEPIPLIDFFQAFIPPPTVPGTLPPPFDDSSGLIYREGLHLTPAGFDLMAAAAFEAFTGVPPPVAQPVL